MPRHPPRAVEAGRIERVLSETQLRHGDVHVEHVEPDGAVVSLPHHQRIELAGELRFADARVQQAGRGLFEDAPVEGARPLHDGEFVGSLDGAGPGDRHVQ